MNVPAWAGFVADFPDDQVEAGGDIKTYGGRNVALAVGSIFAGLGCRGISKLRYLEIQGWEFDFEYGDGGSFSCRVQSFIHPVFWLLFEDDGPSDGTVYVELWRKFGNALEHDPRFHKILWRSFKDGPPEWEEVEAATDPPERTFDEEFPPNAIEAKKIGKGCSPALAALVFIVWPIASGIAGISVGLSSSTHKERVDDIVVGIGMLVIGLGILTMVVWSVVKRAQDR